MSALQSGLGRLSDRALRDEWTTADPSLRTWQDSLTELHDLLLLLAGQVGATNKLLDLLPVGTDTVIEVEDISAKVIGASAAAGPIGKAAMPTASNEAAASASVGGRSFELLGSGAAPAPESRSRPVGASVRLPSRG